MKRGIFRVQTRNTGEAWTTRASARSFDNAVRTATVLGRELGHLAFDGNRLRRYLYVRVLHRGLVLFQRSGDLVYCPRTIAGETSREGARP